MRKTVLFLMFLFSCQNNVLDTNDSSTSDDNEEVVQSYDAVQEKSSIQLTDSASDVVQQSPSCLYPFQIVVPCSCHILSVLPSNINDLCCSGRSLTYTCTTLGHTCQSGRTPLETMCE